jgi:hypothetical protein
VGGDNQSPSFTYQSLKQLSQLVAARSIQRCCRLIHQQQRRVDSESARDCNPLRLATRQLAGERVGPMFDAEQGE